MHFLMKCQKKEIITEEDMPKSVIKTSKNYFREILKRTAEHVELTFGIDLKEVDPVWHC